MLQAFGNLDEDANVRERLPILQRLLSILESRQRQIVEQGETIGGDLNKFFTVFSDINRKIAQQSQRLTDEVSDDLSLDGIARSEVKIISTKRVPCPPDKIIAPTLPEQIASKPIVRIVSFSLEETSFQIKGFTGLISFSGIGEAIVS